MPQGFASMGPRSDERGNKKSPSCSTSQARQLQWGRVLMNAETSFAAMVPMWFPRLQWGRVLMNAETRVTVFETAKEVRASMGPRSDERGNVLRLATTPVRRGFRFNGAAF